MAKISIIVPVYNVDRYLKRCVDSVLSQSFTDFELLLVDDGSPDNSGAICDEYAEIDSRIIVIHKENGGVSSARNAGIASAKGEWVCFVDSDDWVEPTYLENFIDTIRYDTELVLQSFWSHNLRKNVIKDCILPNMRMEGNYNLIQWLEDAKTVHNGFIWHRLFRRDIVIRENASFPEGISIAEDGWFWLRYLRDVKHIDLTSKQGYHYMVGNDGSLTTVARHRTVALQEAIICNFTELMYAFEVPMESKKQHINFVRRYMWRFICGGLLHRAAECNKESKEWLDLMYRLVDVYNFYDVSDVLPSVRFTIFALKHRGCMFETFLIKFAAFYREYETKILRHLWK